MFSGGHFERIIEFLICTQNNGLNFSLQDIDLAQDHKGDNEKGELISKSKGGSELEGR